MAKSGTTINYCTRIMNVIGRDDLQYRYAWSAIAPDDPRRTGAPDSVLLNRGEGYEVLPFINRFCSDMVYKESRKPFGKADALKAERLIHDYLPGNIRSRQNVQEWLMANWSKH